MAFAGVPGGHSNVPAEDIILFERVRGLIAEKSPSVSEKGRAMDTKAKARTRRTPSTKAEDAAMVIPCRAFFCRERIQKRVGGDNGRHFRLRENSDSGLAALSPLPLTAVKERKGSAFFL